MIRIKFFLLFAVIMGCSNEKVSENEQYKETVGVVAGVPSNKYIYYTVNNKSYKKRFKASLYGMLYDEEKFSLRYSVSDPENIEVCYSCPMFLKTEKTHITTGQLLKLFNFRWPFGEEYKIRFDYELNGMRYRREQIIPLNYKDRYPEIKEGAYYNVECWSENGIRAIMDLSHPIHF